MTEDARLPFSQRNGLHPVPPQLKLGEVSDDLRRLLDFYIGLEIDRETFSNYNSRYFSERWQRVAMDFHVLFLKHGAVTFRNRPNEVQAEIRARLFQSSYGDVFDLVEFFLRHPLCSSELKQEVRDAFVLARAAYRVVEHQVVAIGSDQQAEAFERAIADTQEYDALAARRHLLAAGVELRNSNWPGSVRESIHAVESVAVRLVPGTTTLGHALSALEKKGHLHGGLKSAFSSLYGYSSDEEGVRHALVFKKEAEVDEADALFMLGACASFVSYMIMRNA